MIVISSQLVRRSHNDIYTDVSFFHILSKANSYFKEMRIVCREDRRDKRKKAFKLDTTFLNIHTYRAGIYNKYISIIIEAPIIFLKLFYFVLTHRNEIDIVWIPEIRIVGILACCLARIFVIPSFFYIRGDNEEEANIRVKNVLFPLRAFLTVFIRIESLIGKYFTKKNPTVVCGHDLLAKFKNSENITHNFISTLIEEKDIAGTSRRIDDKRDFKLLFVGRLVKGKGLEFLVSALPVLLNNRSLTNRWIELIIVGSGEHKKKLIEMVTQNDLNEHVKFNDYISNHRELDLIYSDCDAFVMPSLTEGTPKTVPEAMAKGLPVIATNVGDLPFMIEHRKNGFIVEPANSSEIASSIAELINRPELYESMSKSALIRAGELTFKKQFEKMMGVIEQLANKGRPAQ